MIIITGLFAIGAQLAFHPIFQQGFHVADLALCAVQLSAIALAFGSVRPRAA